MKIPEATTLAFLKAVQGKGHRDLARQEEQGRKGEEEGGGMTKKWALEYVFTCAMVAKHLKQKRRFTWIIRTAFDNWPLALFAKLQGKFKKEGIKI